MKKSKLILISYITLLVLGMIFLTSMSFVYQEKLHYKKSTIQLKDFKHLYVKEKSFVELKNAGSNSPDEYSLQIAQINKIKYDISGDTLYIKSIRDSITGSFVTLYVKELFSISGVNCKIWGNNLKENRLEINLHNSSFTGKVTADSLWINLNNSNCLFHVKQPIDFVKISMENDSYINLPAVKEIEVNSIDETCMLSIN